MHNLTSFETRYLVIAYLPSGSCRFQLEGPVLVETRDYIHFYLTGTKLEVSTVAYVVVCEYQVGITEQQATDFFITGFNELLRATMTLEESVAIPIRAPACQWPALRAA